MELAICSRSHLLLTSLVVLLLLQTSVAVPLSPCLIARDVGRNSSLYPCDGDSVEDNTRSDDNLLRYPAVYRIIAPTPVFLHIFSIKRPMQRIALETVARVAHDELQHLIYSSDNPVVAEGGRTFRGGGLQISVSPLITHRRPVRCWDVFVALAGLVEELERYGINEVKVLMFLRTYELAKPEALITVVRL